MDSSSARNSGHVNCSPTSRVKALPQYEHRTSTHLAIGNMLNFHVPNWRYKPDRNESVSTITILKGLL